VAAKPTGFEPGARSAGRARRGPLPCIAPDGVPLQARRPHRDARHGGSDGVRVGHHACPQRPAGRRL